MIQLRQHQNEAREATNSAIEEGKERIILEMATGTGKSFTQAALLGDRIEAGDSIQIAFVPSQDLVAQNAKSYRKYLSDQGIEANVIGVFAPDEDMMREGCDLVTTNGEEIMKGIEGGKPTIILATYASSEAVQRANELGLSVDTMLCDEAHRMASGSSIEDAGVWSTPLFDDKISAQRRVFYTATMRAEDREDSITMSNAELFGERVFELGYTEAVKRGILEQYRPFPVSIERAQIEEAMAEAGIEREEGMTDGAWRNQERAFATALMSETALENRRANGEPLSMMTLHPNREIATMYDELISERFEKSGSDVPTMVVHGAATEEKERALSIGRSLKGQMAVSVVDMFREGTDMPGLNTLMVGRNSKSSILLVQAMGRVVRKYSEEWRDESGYLPNKEPHIYVPVIVDSRDPADKPDCALAANLFSAMLRADDGAREAFEKACEAEGKNEIIRGPVKDGADLGEMSETASMIGKVFQLDMDQAATKSLSMAIAQATRGNESIGQFNRFAGQYEAWLEKNNYEQPTLPGKAEWREADTPEKKAVLEQRRHLVAWHQSVLTRHANKTMYPEEAKRLYEIKGFSFKEKDTAPEKLVEHFEAYKMYAGKVPENSSLRPWATAEGRLSRLLVESGQIALEGERKDSRGKVLPRQKGDANLERFAQVLANRQALRGEVPSMVSIKEPVKLRGKVSEMTCPQTGKSRLCFVPSRGEAVPGTPWKARHYQPAIPLDMSSVEKDKMRDLLDKEGGFTLSPGRRGIQAQMNARVVSQLDPEWGGFVDILGKQPVGTKLSTRDMADKMSMRPVGALEVEGWSDKTNEDMVKMAARARRLHALGQLDKNVVSSLDKAPGFSWVENEDYSKRVGTGKHEDLMPKKAFQQLYLRLGNKLEDHALFEQDNGIANTAKAGRDLIEKARGARAEAVALKPGDPAAKAKMNMYHKATKMMEPAMPAFNSWASWKKKPLVREEMVVAKARKEAVR